MRKFLSVTISILLVLTAFIGCKSSTVEESTEEEKTQSELIIQMYLGGYGTKGVEAVAKEFEKAYETEKYSVKIIPNASLVMNGAYNEMRLGPTLQQTDLFLVGAVNYKTILREGSKFVKQDYTGEYAIEDLTDMYGTKVYGEEVLYKDKITSAFLAANTTDGKQYSSNWAAAPTGIMYNNNHFKQNGWTIPTTSNEMLELTAKIKEKGFTPFQWANNASYWEYISMVWWRQLATDEEADNFWNCIDSYGETSVEVFKSYARLKSYSLIEDMIALKTGNSAKDAMTTTHIQSQTAVMTDQAKVVMMPTGDWAENEMKAISIIGDIGMMKAPVASDVIYVGGDTSNFRFSTVKTEEKLREVISAIDNGAASIDGVDSKDFDALKKIRSFVFSEGFPSEALIPAYSSEKDIAKKFLLFMASDKAIQLYYDTTGCYLPFDSKNVKTSEKSTLMQKDVLKITNGASYISKWASNNPLFYMTELGYNNWQYFMEKRIGASGADQLSGKGWYDYIYNYFSDNFANYQSLVNVGN